MAATAGAGGYPGAGDPVQKYADFPIDTERKQAVIRAQSALYFLPESADVSLRVDDGSKGADARNRGFRQGYLRPQICGLLKGSLNVRDVYIIHPWAVVDPAFS